MVIPEVFSDSSFYSQIVSVIKIARDIGSRGGIACLYQVHDDIIIPLEGISHISTIEQYLLGH